MATNSYNGLDAFLQGGRDKNRRKLENNTYAIRYGKDTFSKECIAVRLHATDILTFYKNGDVVFFAGGWETVTTKARINTYAPSGWHVYSENGDWRLANGYWSDPNRFDVAFVDGIHISGRTGSVPKSYVRSGAALDRKRAEARKERARKLAKERRAERKFRACFAWLLPLGQRFSVGQESSEQPPADARIAYHFIMRRLHLSYTDVPSDVIGHTQNGGLPVRIGQTLHVVADPEPCHAGLHASDTPSEAFSFCQGPILCEVAVWGKIADHGDKLAAQYRHVLRAVDVTAVIDARVRYSLDTANCRAEFDENCRKLLRGEQLEAKEETQS